MNFYNLSVNTFFLNTKLVYNTHTCFSELFEFAASCQSTTEFLNKTPILQDMAPKGGYGEVPFSRVIRKRGPGGLTLLLGSLAVSAVGWVLVTITNRERRMFRRQMMDARIALYPLFLAEHDRNTLRQMKDFEDAEVEIMKDVPSWRAGESVYYTTRWVKPIQTNLDTP